MKQINEGYKQGLEINLFPDSDLVSLFNRKVKSLINKESQIIEFGCGCANNIRMLIEYGYNNISGFDISERAIDIAKTMINNKYNNTNVNLFSEDFNNLQLDKKYDLIIDRGTITAIKNINIKNISNCLNSNGILLSCCFLEKSETYIARPEMYDTINYFTNFKEDIEKYFNIIYIEKCYKNLNSEKDINYVNFIAIKK
jgi:SAM-dependent methyltransferase